MPKQDCSCVALDTCIITVITMACSARNTPYKKCCPELVFRALRYDEDFREMQSLSISTKWWSFVLRIGMIKCDLTT
jgi:hypothetical protein